MSTIITMITYKYQHWPITTTSVNLQWTMIHYKTVNVCLTPSLHMMLWDNLYMTILIVKRLTAGADPGMRSSLSLKSRQAVT